MVGFNATSAPDEAIASADNTRFAVDETVRRELMLSAHASTTPASKNNAHSDKSNAAPDSRLQFRDTFLIQLLALIWCPPQRDDCFPRIGCVRTTDADLHERGHPVSAGPPRQPSVGVRIKVGYFKAVHIFNQRHPGFVSFGIIGIVLRLTQNAQIKLIALVVRRLQTQHDGELAGRIPRKQPGASATIPSYFVALPIIQLEGLAHHSCPKRAQALPVSCKQITEAIILRIRGCCLR